MKLDLRGVHSIQRMGKHIVLDVESGSVHLFDGPAAGALEGLRECEGETTLFLERFPKEAHLLKEMEALYEQGTLFSPPIKDLKMDMPDQLTSLCLNVAHDCNLACDYCFAAQGNFGGQPVLMTPQTGRRAVDYLIAHSGHKRMLEIDFFGGEPLMAWDTVQAVIDYAKAKVARAAKVIKFSMTTNGLTLNQDKLDYLKKEKVGLVLSLDGRKAVHDRMRKTKNGRASYERVLANFRKVQGLTEDYVVRGTYTKYNLDFTQDLLSFLEEGFDHISIEPVVCDKETDYRLTEEDLGQIEKEYEKLAGLYLDHYRKKDPIDFFHFNVNLKKGPCIYKRVIACGAGYEYLAITPEGDIYPCHQFVGDEDWKMGSIWPQTGQDLGQVADPLNQPTNQETKALFQANTVYAKADCRDCWARYYCSGGCHANAYAFNGSINKPYKLGCKIQKIRLELAIFVQVMILLCNDEDNVDNTLQKDRNDLYTKDKIKEMLSH